MIQHYLNFLEGMDAQISPFLMSDNKLKILDNCLISQKLGAIVKRLGSIKVGTTLQDTKSITGLHHFHQSASVQKILATINNSGGTNLTLKYNNAGTWTDISISTAWDEYEDAKVEFEDFLGHCFMVGYDATNGVFLPVATLTGTTFSTSANLTNAPQGKFIIRYRDRLYVLNCYYGSAAYPYRVRISSAVSAGALGDWDYTGNYIDVDFSEEITGAGENWDKLMIFTQYCAYMYDQVNQKKIWDVGCSAHRTIKNLGAKMIWANSYGVWLSNGGGAPENIGGRIVDFIKAATPANMFAEVIDEEYHLYVGAVKVDGVTYTNCKVVIDFATATWRIEEHYNTMTAFARYNDSGIERLYMGTSNGRVLAQSKYTDASPAYDDHYIDTNNPGQPIHAWWVTKPYDLGAPHKEKILTKLIAYAEKAGALKLFAKVKTANSRITDEPIPCGMLTKYVNELTPEKPIKGNFIEFSGSENSRNPYFSFYGFTTIDDQPEE